MKSFGYRSDRLRFEWGERGRQLWLPCKGWIGVGSQRDPRKQIGTQARENGSLN